MINKIIDNNEKSVGTDESTVQKIDNLNLSSTYIAQRYSTGSCSTNNVDLGYQGGGNTLYIHLLLPRGTAIACLYNIEGFWNQILQNRALTKFLLSIIIDTSF